MGKKGKGIMLIYNKIIVVIIIFQLLLYLRILWSYVDKKQYIEEELFLRH